MISCNFYETIMDLNNKDSYSQNSNKNSKYSYDINLNVVDYLKLIE